MCQVQACLEPYDASHLEKQSRLGDRSRVRRLLGGIAWEEEELDTGARSIIRSGHRTRIKDYHGISRKVSSREELTSVGVDKSFV